MDAELEQYLQDEVNRIAPLLAAMMPYQAELDPKSIGELARKIVLKAAQWAADEAIKHVEAT